MTRKKKHSNKKPMWPIGLIAFGVLVVAAAFFLFFQNNWPADPTGPKLVTVMGDYSDIKRVTLEDAKTAYDTGTAVFVDVRSADSYAVSHITGALSLPLDELETRLDELDPADWIIPYCT